MRRLLPILALLPVGISLGLGARAMGQPGDPNPREEMGQQQQQDQLLTGTFVLAEPYDVARERVTADINQAANKTNFFIRGFVRDKLMAKNPVHRRIRTEVHGNTVVVVYDSDRYETENGQWKEVTAKGEQVRLLQQVQGNHIYQTFRSGDGTKNMSLTFAPDRSSLRLDITVTSGKLPEPLRYSLSYQREAATPT